MEAPTDWEPLIRRLEQLLRLKSFPVAFKMLKKKVEMNDIPFLRRMETKKTLCQMITLVRNFDWTVGADPNDFISHMCPSIIGLTDIPEFVKNGTFRSMVWTRNRAEGKQYEASVPRLPLGKYEAVVMAPLVYNPFDPDIVLIYANPAQMILLINAIQFEEYEVMNFFCVGESSCSDAIVRCYNSQKPSLTIPCYGERRYAHAQDEDLVMAIPAKMMVKILRGLETLYKRGIRYPISYAGAEADVTFAFPAAYGSEDSLKAIQGNDNRLLLGVTGSIATGKSTVALMLEELGAPIIDFDIISRELVEPEKPAWHDIVSFFGKQLLHDDGTLNREKLREEVFRDLEKRKMLERFIHPRIGEEFTKLVKQYANLDPNAIIQVVIPLLIETNMQAYFHNLLMVHVPEEEQIKRLVKRDEISEEMAISMIRAQMPVEEKKGYCDLEIDNSGTLDETREKAVRLWEHLREIQKTNRSATNI